MESEARQIKILNRIDVGGMAEIFRAKRLDTGALIAIKRILPGLSEQEEFVRMFIDEATVCMALRHPNIVHVEQLGRLNGDLFLAMEYVAGINLRELLNFSNSYSFFLPAHEVVRIAIRILDGLAYAHAATDDSGQALQIIHRDISPPNILLGYNGDVKITDFGLAKAKTQIAQTIPGLIKGKFSYLSPEAAYGESLDLRSDLYAVGIVMWEMLTANPLFDDPVEMQILKLVRQSIIPPISNYNDAVDPKLEIIVRKALSRNRGDRYQTAKEFADVLHDYLKTIDAPPSELSKIVCAISPPPDDSYLLPSTQEEILIDNASASKKQNKSSTLNPKMKASDSALNLKRSADKHSDRMSRSEPKIVESKKQKKQNDISVDLKKLGKTIKLQQNNAVLPPDGDTLEQERTNKTLLKWLLFVLIILVGALLLYGTNKI